MICLPKNVLPIVGMASKEEGRYSMCGVLLEEMRDDSFRLVATDGKKLGIIQGPPSGQGVPVAFDPGDSAKYLVPTNVLQQAFKDAGKDGGVRISCRDKVISIESGTAYRAEGEIEGRFPDYALVLPKSDPIAVAMVNADVLISCLKTAAAVAKGVSGGGDPHVRIMFFKENCPFGVQSANTDGQTFDGIVMPVSGSLSGK